MDKFALKRLKTTAFVWIGAMFLLGANWQLLRGNFSSWWALAQNVAAAAAIVALVWNLGARRSWRCGFFAAFFTVIGGGLVFSARTPTPALYLALGLLLAGWCIRLKGPSLLTAAAIAGAAGPLGFHSFSGALTPAAPFCALYLAELFLPGHWIKRRFRRLLVDVARVVAVLLAAFFVAVLCYGRSRYPDMPVLLPGTLLLALAVIALWRFREIRALDRQLLAFTALTGVLLVGNVMVFESVIELKKIAEKPPKEVVAAGNKGAEK